MKRLIIPGLILLVLLALFQGGNRLLAKTLDVELARLLTSELGLPVTLAPTRARISNLTVHSPKLVMGDPANPALVATGVSVSLQWSDLLRGEIRLRHASGSTLMVNPSLWPGSNAPWPTDYRFLEPYLPDSIQLQSASYVDADGRALTFDQPAWVRQYPGASLSWQGQVRQQAVALGVKLVSLDDLLKMARLQLDIATTASGQDDSVINVSLDIKPGKESGYLLDARIDAAGTTATAAITSERAWEWPDHSSTRLEQFDVKKLRALAKRYRADQSDPHSGSAMALPLPRLALPHHTGTVTIAEGRWQDEVVTDSTVDFTLGPDGVTVPTLVSHGPSGVLHGQVNVTSSDAGWQLELSANLEAAGTDDSLAKPYLDADWFWSTGNATLSGRGDTGHSLLNSLQGDITLDGSHRGAVVTPVTFRASLDNQSSEFALDKIELKVAQGSITGTASLSGQDRLRLTGNLSLNAIDLDFLIPPAGKADLPGFAMPTYLADLPGLDLDLQLEVNDLRVRGIRIDQAGFSFLRTADKASLVAHARGNDRARLKLQLEAIMAPDQPATVSLRADISSFLFSQLFGQASPFPDTRTSGTIRFSSRGKEIAEIFRAMQGKADLDLDHRPDQNWRRPPNPEEQLRLAAGATLVIADERITGIQFSAITIDSTLQNITGSVSLVQGRVPWLRADLTSDKLDLANLAQIKATDNAQAPEADSLESLRALGASELTLVAGSVQAGDFPLRDVTLRVSTAPDNIAIEQFDFALGQGRLASKGSMRWHEKVATLSIEANIDKIGLGQFLSDSSATTDVPLSGTIALNSEGATSSSLLAELTGDIRLTASPGNDSAASAAPARVDMTARQTEDGMRAVIHRFQWQGTDLAGTLQYRDTTPPLLEVEISGGTLSLLAWEGVAEETQDKKSDESLVTRTARASADLIGDVVMAPLRLISGPREAQRGDKLFSSTPLPFEWLQKYQARVKGKLDKLISREENANDLDFSAELLSSKLTAQASAGELNGGSAEASLVLDAGVQPAAVALKGTFRNLQGDLVKTGFPRSGHFDFSSHGSSPAELAATIDGVVYLELGAGTLDYENLMLLTADVATNVFETLIPGADKTPPKLECAVTLGLFKDGIGTTPYGYAARTNLANLVGRVEVNLKKELLHLNFSSSSRKGLGLSVGNVFSNTVEVEGPLTDPSVIPNTTGLLWRGWAAVMTGGLSVVGESVLKRALASENPCESVSKHIHKDFCTSSLPGASSAMICPAT